MKCHHVALIGFGLTGQSVVRQTLRSSNVHLWLAKKYRLKILQTNLAPFVSHPRLHFCNSIGPTLKPKARLTGTIITKPPAYFGGHARDFGGSPLPLLAGKLVYISTTGVYQKLKWRDESDWRFGLNDSPEFLNYQLRLQVEKNLKIYRRPSQVVILRPGGIFGEGRNFIEHLLRDCFKLTPQRFKSPAFTHDRYIARIHSDDLARLAIKCLLKPDGPQQINAVNHVDQSQLDILEELLDKSQTNLTDQSENYFLQAIYRQYVWLYTLIIASSRLNAPSEINNSGNPQVQALQSGQQPLWQLADFQKIWLDFLNQAKRELTAAKKELNSRVLSKYANFFTTNDLFKSLIDD